MSAVEHFAYDFRVARPATPLRHHVTESIRTAIAVGKFKVGERIRERELCEMTGVSRTLVREALRQLESEGLIEVVAHRGPVVAAITREQAIGIYQVREVLEGLAAELFARHAPDERRSEMRDALENVRQAYGGDDPFAWIAAKNRMYACMIEGSGNEALGKSLGMLNARAMLLRARSIGAPGRRDRSIAELEALVEALVAGKPKGARDAAMRHVREAAKVAIAGFPSDSGGVDHASD
jgi:DNA-binding GntR family transcriptional regulator